MTTTTKRTTKPTTKAKGAERLNVQTLSDVERLAAQAIADVQSGSATIADAMATVGTLSGTIVKRTTHDTIAIHALVGSVAVKSYTLKHGDPAPKAKVTPSNVIARHFVATPEGKASGRGEGSLVMSVNIARIPNRHAVLTLWDGWCADAKASASDPKAFDPVKGVVAFQRFASAWIGGRVNPDTGVIFATKADMTKPEGEALTQGAKALATSVVAHERSTKASNLKARKALAEAKASDANIGTVKVSDLASLTKPQRAKVVALLQSFDTK